MITAATTVTTIGNHVDPKVPTAFKVAFVALCALPVVALTKDCRTVNPKPNVIAATHLLS